MKIENKIVVRYRDGKIKKGHTYDFFPNRPVFHLTAMEGEQEIIEINLSELKALFFVKSFEGSKDHPRFDDQAISERLKTMPGLKLEVTFFDGEKMYGTSQGYDPTRKGFFLFLADQDVNDERVFVIKESTISVKVLQ